jgi:hypothetical protein
MDGDALGAEALTVDGKLSYIRGVAAARIADGGHLVDIDTEFCHNIIQIEFDCKNTTFF